jgi:hypothetical protein
MDKKTEIINQLLTDFLSRYRSSELYHEINSVVRELIGYLSHLLNDTRDIKLFFKYLPQVISEIPPESEETPLGHVHYYSAGVFEFESKKRRFNG